MRLAPTLIGVIGFAVIPFSGARAQDRPGREQPRLDARFFDRLDSDKDGVITLEEIPAERRERAGPMIQRMDRDGDGKVSREEFDGALKQFQAAPGRGRGGDTKPADRPGAGPGGVPLFRLIDRDGDGRLSRDELRAAAESVMKRDRNSDGFITPEELGLPTGPAPDGRPVAKTDEAAGLAAGMLRRADKNGDERLSREELPEPMRDRFEQMDANGDGSVDERELSRALSRLRRLREGAARPERPPGGSSSVSPATPAGEADVKANRERIAGFLRKHDLNADGQVSASEFPSDRGEEFGKLDLDGDGQLTPRELARHLSKQTDRPGDGRQPDAQPRPQKDRGTQD